MYAIIEDRGTQIKVQAGDVFNIDLVTGGEMPKTLTFDRVLLVGDAAGSAANIGTPYLSGASVSADVLEEVKGEKLESIMYKRRKGQRTKKGHRQRYLRVKITGINA